jgi:uncharacterized linocin/CFP29 family protein
MNIHSINDTLSKYLDNEEFSDYKALISLIINNDDIYAKYNLSALLMNQGTAKLVTKQLVNQLHNFYSSDKHIEEYVNSVVGYNPIFGEIYISSKSGRDIDHDFSLNISIPCSGDDLNREMKTIKEVLTMLLIQAKTVCP